jgi:hypothetical protein
VVTLIQNRIELRALCIRPELSLYQQPDMLLTVESRSETSVYYPRSSPAGFESHYLLSTLYRPSSNSLQPISYIHMTIVLLPLHSTVQNFCFFSFVSVFISNPSHLSPYFSPLFSFNFSYRSHIAKPNI